MPCARACGLNEAPGRAVFSRCARAALHRFVHANVQARAFGELAEDDVDGCLGTVAEG